MKANQSSGADRSASGAHQPGVVLLAAQKRADQIRRQDDDLKREIAHLVQVVPLSYEQARQYVLRKRGLLRS